MKLLFGTLAGISVGAIAAILGRRYAGALLWWIFTTDLRSTR